MVRVEKYISTAAQGISSAATYVKEHSLRARACLSYYTSQKKSWEETLNQMNQKASSALSQASQREIYPLLPSVSPPTEIAPSPRVHQQKILEKNLSNKVTSFVTLTIMRGAAGIKEKNNLTILKLAQLSSSGNSSLWEIFSSEYQMGFFRKIFTFLVYLIYYKTSLISNTVDAYLLSFIQGMTKDLTAEDRKTRRAIIHTILEEAKDFLLKDLKATQAYVEAYEQAGTRSIESLETFRERPIKDLYGSLKSLCEKFCAYRVQVHSPHVKFFTSLQTIPLLGYLFSGLEWLVNRLIIQRAMKNYILPGILEASIHEQMKEIGPDQIPFATSLTKLFTSQLTALRSSVSSGQTPDVSPKSSLMDSQMEEDISDVVDFLLQAIRYEGTSFPEKLREKLNHSDNFFDQKIAESIKNSMKEGLALLFHQLDSSAKSGDLTRYILELSLEAFNRDPRHQRQTESDYKAAKNSFNQEGQKLCEELVKKALSSEKSPMTILYLRGVAEEYLSKMDSSFESLQKKLEETFSSRRSIPDTASLESLMEREKETSKTLATATLWIKNLSSEQALLHLPKSIDPVHASEIQNQVHDSLKRAQNSLDSILKAQSTSHAYMDELQILLELSNMQKLLLEIPIEQARKPEQFIAQRLLNFKNRLQFLEDSSKIAPHLKQPLSSIRNLLELVSNHQRVSDAIDLISSKGGLLDTLYEAQQTRRAPEGFDHQGYLTLIGKELDALTQQGTLSQKDCRDLKTAIGDGSLMKKRWSSIEEISHRIKDQARPNVEKNSEVLSSAILSTKQQVERHSTKSTARRDFEKAQRSISAIFKEKEPLSHPMSKNFKQIMALSLGFLTGSPTLSFLGGGLSQWIQGFKTEDYKKAAFSAAKKTAQESGAALILSQTLLDPYTAGSALLGRLSTNLIGSSFHTKVFENIQECLTNIYHFSLTKRVPTSLVVRTIRALSGPRS